MSERTGQRNSDERIAILLSVTRAFAVSAVLMFCLRHERVKVSVGCRLDDSRCSLTATLKQHPASFFVLDPRRCWYWSFPYWSLLIATSLVLIIKAAVSGVDALSSAPFRSESQSWHLRGAPRSHCAAPRLHFLCWTCFQQVSANSHCVLHCQFEASSPDLVSDLFTPHEGHSPSLP